MRRRRHLDRLRETLADLCWWADTTISPALDRHLPFVGAMLAFILAGGAVAIGLVTLHQAFLHPPRMERPSLILRDSDHTLSPLRSDPVPSAPALAGKCPTATTQP